MIFKNGNQYMNNKVIWCDITNTPQVHFLLAILNALKSRGFGKFQISTRDFSETVKLMKLKYLLPFTVIGNYGGDNILNKVVTLIDRTAKIFNHYSDFDISLSCGSDSAIWNSFVKNKKSIAYGDNDLVSQWTYGFFVNYALFPKSIPKKILTRQGLKSNKLYQYNGFKEHIYIADFKPDPEFKHHIPFNNYVVVRPENIKANYVQGNISKSITHELLKKLSRKGVNILFMPRYDEDRSYSVGINNIFIPDQPINGLDACFYSDGVFTGAGTFAREAACLGVPSFSFFLGKKLLAVDQDLINQGLMFYSRDTDKLTDKFIYSSRKEYDKSIAQAVQEEVITKTIQFIEES